MVNALVSEKVRGQYEDLPYPERNPQDEHKRICLANVESPDRVNQICFNGNRDFTKKIRVLIAGGGTGDSAVQWAAFLRNNPDAEIVYVDFSTASRKIAEERLQLRGLENKVKMITDSLLNIPKLGLGKFDIINCCGVLHHLENPEAGLKILADCLDEDGAMMLMVYARYGRLGVYPLQEIMRYINVDAQDSQAKINNTKAVLNCVTPANNFFLSLAVIQDLNVDAEIYDIFMHDQDRAYSVQEVYDFAASASLKHVSFTHGTSADVYTPERYIADKALLEKVKKLSVSQQQSIAEVLNSTINKHAFYLTKKEMKKLEMDLELIPSFSICMPPQVQEQLVDLINKSGDIANINFPQFKLSFIKTPNLAEIIANIDGVASLREVLLKVMKKSKAKNCNLQTLLAEFKALYNLLENYYQIFLRQPGIPPYENFAHYQTEIFGHLSVQPA